MDLDDRRRLVTELLEVTGKLLHEALRRFDWRQNGVVMALSYAAPPYLRRPRPSASVTKPRPASRRRGRRDRLTTSGRLKRRSFVPFRSAGSPRCDCDGWISEGIIVNGVTLYHFCRLRSSLAHRGLEYYENSSPWHCARSGGRLRWHRRAVNASGRATTKCVG
jgi:hypothetical protein